MPDLNQVPLMFQAQIGGRSQIQRLIPGAPRQQAYDWTEQWQEACDLVHQPDIVQEAAESSQSPIERSKDCAFTWRMVTNSGQDAGLIRPVIGGRGWAYFPGSSMKGAFLRACRKLLPELVTKYCGGLGEDGELHPGILRFRGGYPKTDDWLDNSLVDVVHPQENWQIDGVKARHETPKIQISLYQPTFVFKISSVEPLEEAEWTKIWEIWSKAIERGLGSRVSAGYGQVKAHGDSRLLSVFLSGQGVASQRIDRQAEFRPNLFKAALRGHTRRLFSGIAEDATAEMITKLLWGGFNGRNGAIVGLLGVEFHASDLELDEFVCSNKTRMPVYKTGDSTLNLLVMQEGSEEQRIELRKFLIQLVKFSMLLGGFGKSWRRIDHRRFFPDYRRQMIGCHWEFTSKSEKLYVIAGAELTGITKFLDGLQESLAGFSLLRLPGKPDDSLREAWRKGRVQVWGRIAEDEENSLAIKWFHGEYAKEQRIKGTELTGKMGQIGRIWHRMYPRYIRTKDGEIKRRGEEYVELLTIFPDSSETTGQFLKFLGNSEFKQLW